MKLKENKGMSLIVFIIVLAVLVVVAGGVIVYLLNNPVREKVAIQTPSNVQSNMSNNENKVVNDKPSVDIKENETKVEEVVREITADEKYNAYLKNLKKEITSINKYSYIMGSYELDMGDKGGYSIEINSNCDLSIHFSDEQLDKKYGTDKLASNVIAFYNCYAGNGGGRNLYFIKDDGTIWMAEIDNDVVWENKSEIKINKITKYKNIVTILNFYDGVDTGDYPGVMTPLFIDIEGKIYK